ncbi:MAG: SMP-30/gluconolactonase/LRE family protein [Pseudomonadota bacterium]
MERLAKGFRFTEGPIWFPEQDCLLFSDIPASCIYKLTADGRVSVFKAPSGHSNGLTRDAAGRLIACEHGNRRVTRTETDGALSVLADSYDGQQLNSPNDVVVGPDGAIYFTDPPYGIRPEQQEFPIQGVYRVDPEHGGISLVADDFDRPNGLAFSPDGKRLYIDDSSARRHIRVFDVGDDGSLKNGRLFHDMNVPQRGAPDGMSVDAEGNVYCTGAGGVWVFGPGGQHLGMIQMPEKPSNCAWGDQDCKSLYITAPASVYRIRVSIPGSGVALQAI